MKPEQLSHDPFTLTVEENACGISSFDMHGTLNTFLFSLEDYYWLYPSKDYTWFETKANCNLIGYLLIVRTANYFNAIIKHFLYSTIIIQCAHLKGFYF